MLGLARYRKPVSLMFATFCVVLAAGCSGHGKCSPSSGPLESEKVAFYRHSNEQAVFRVSATMYCLVISESQMAAFGGFAQVRVVPPGLDFKRGKTPLPGLACPTP
jgi:hypothetical protein